MEGTILTVIRAGAEAATAAAPVARDLRDLLEQVVGSARAALARTPDLLPVLRQAGVVDSGGRGIVLILEGMLQFIHGQVSDLTSASPTLAVPTSGSAQSRALPAAGALPYPYDVQFLLVGKGLNLAAVRAAIEAMGDSALVVGDEALIKVHVHVTNPGVPLSYAISLGAIEDIVVENMQSQMEARAGIDSTRSQPQETAPPAPLAVVAVAAGPGLAQIFSNLGVAAIVEGGQSNNPSAEAIVAAVESTNAASVIILPNNKNIILAAEQAAQLMERPVHVLPTRSAPEGISAMLAYRPDGDPAAVAAAMTAAAQQITTAAITTASRSVSLNGVSVEKGDYMGIAAREICSAGPTISAVLPGVLQSLSLAERELLSLYYGAGITAQEAAQLVEEVAALYPGIEVECFDGGQPHYYYLLGAE